MSLRDALQGRGIHRALVVDDALDAVPRAADMDGSIDEWSLFAADLDEERQALIDAAFPDGRGKSFGDKVADDRYVAAVWAVRGKLGEPAELLFERYVSQQATDMGHVKEVVARLEALGLECVTRGREFLADVRDADLVVIDLFLGGAQTVQAFDLSKRLLREAIQERLSAPPLVVLMSRSGTLEANREVFRNEVGLIDSGFRIVSKLDLLGGRLEVQLERLVGSAAETRKLARFFHALEQGVAGAAARAIGAMRRLTLADIGQIQQLLLEFEGEPTGSYLVDVFDRVLQHEVEADKGIIKAALQLSEITSGTHPPPFVAGSPGLQDLVQRMLTHSGERLRLLSSPDWPVAFGDVLKVAPPIVAAGSTRSAVPPFPVEVGPNDVLLVLTPACDLQRGGAQRVLVLIGEAHPLDRRSWHYGSDARTPAIRIDDTLCHISWNLKHIDTVSWPDLKRSLEQGSVRIVARLREAPALEIQQRLLSGLGRVGLIAAMPGTFPVQVEAHVPDETGIPRLLSVQALTEGAVCYVGRDAKANPAPRLVMTEPACDGLQEALLKLPDERVAPEALKPLKHIRSSGELRRKLAAGLDLGKVVNKSTWVGIPEADAPGAPSMALIGWNTPIPNTALDKNLLRGAGVMILVTSPEGASGKLTGLTGIGAAGTPEQGDPTSKAASGGLAAAD